MNKGTLLYTGSVKKVYEAEGRPEFAIFEFSDRISVFDKRIPSLVPHKGEVICSLSSFWFKKCDAAGLNTHFIEQLSPTEMLVKRVEVERDYSLITPERSPLLIPCEFIVRHFAAGSFLDRNKDVRPGSMLSDPYCETSTKVEKTDRLISRQEALSITKLTEAELDHIWSVCLKVDQLIDEQTYMGGLIHADGKKEFGRDVDGDLMLVDVLGTPDEDRWWDLASYRCGEIVEVSKEIVRQHYRSIGYKDALYTARKNGEAEPEIPPMPEDLIQKCSAAYVDLYERLTGRGL